MGYGTSRMGYLSPGCRDCAGAINRGAVLSDSSLVLDPWEHRRSVWMWVAMLMWAVILMAALAIVATPARAAVTYTGNSPGNDAGETNKASVTFSLSLSGTTTNLLVTLTNLGTYKPNDPQDILTSVFFSLTGDPALKKISALLNAGSVGVKNGSTLTVPGGVIGGSWAYAAGLNGAPGGADEGISAAGFGLFGPKNVFPGSALPNDANKRPGGIRGGLTTTTDDGSQYNGGLSGRPFIKDSAVFTLGAVPASFTLTDISTVSFQYGTKLGTEPNVPGTIPEASSVALTLVGIVLLGLLNRKRKRQRT